MSDSVRITVTGEKGTQYSWLEYNYGYDEVGDFGRRYPHGEWNGQELHDNKTPAFGILEYLGQSEDAPPFLWKEDVVRVSITNEDGTFGRRLTN